ncbi:MAG: putative solute:sodium symporter small subunit [Parasphingorhabdus sp.]
MPWAIGCWHIKRKRQGDGSGCLDLPVRRNIKSCLRNFALPPSLVSNKQQGGGNMSDDSLDAPQGDPDRLVTSANETAYWSQNIRLLSTLMTIWFVVSFGAGILFREFLDQFSIGGYPLGFWFAQQGAIYCFILLIVFYSVRMKRIERQYDLDD